MSNGSFTDPPPGDCECQCNCPCVCPTEWPDNAIYVEGTQLEITWDTSWDLVTLGIVQANNYNFLYGLYVNGSNPGYFNWNVSATSLGFNESQQGDIPGPVFTFFVFDAAKGPIWNGTEQYDFGTDQFSSRSFNISAVAPSPSTGPTTSSSTSATIFSTKTVLATTETLAGGSVSTVPGTTLTLAVAAGTQAGTTASSHTIATSTALGTTTTSSNSASITSTPPAPVSHTGEDVGIGVGVGVGVLLLLLAAFLFWRRRSNRKTPGRDIGPAELDDSRGDMAERPLAGERYPAAELMDTQAPVELGGESRGPYEMPATRA